MNQLAWSALSSVGLPMFLSIPISMISVKNQDDLIASEKGSDCATGGDWNARGIVDADREGGRWHIVQSDELLTAFLQLEAMFSAETIPGSYHANIWAAGIESASSGAQQDAVSAASRTHNIWQLQTFNEPRPNPT
jgi:hypothetical protein